MTTLVEYGFGIEIEPELVQVGDQVLVAKIGNTWSTKPTASDVREWVTVTETNPAAWLIVAEFANGVDSIEIHGNRRLVARRPKYPPVVVDPELSLAPYFPLAESTVPGLAEWCRKAPR